MFNVRIPNFHSVTLLNLKGTSDHTYTSAHSTQKVFTASSYPFNPSPAIVPLHFDRNVRNFSEFFARMYIADMNFDNGRFDCGDGVADCNRCMRISAGI